MLMLEVNVLPRLMWMGWGHAVRAAVALAVLICLLGLAAANVSVRASWSEVEDGVLWTSTPQGITATSIASGGSGEYAGIETGDVLLAIDGRPITSVSDVIAVQHAASTGTELTYTMLRLGSREVRSVGLALAPAGVRALYFLLTAVAIFSLFVGATVRLRRPSNPATLHFFWLTVAFFGVLAFSYSGRLDRLDWIFYWADVVAMLALPPLFLHFALVFPERTPGWARMALGASLVPLIYAPAAALGAFRVVVLRGRLPAGVDFTAAIELLDRVELLYLALCVVASLFVMIRALGRVRSVTSRRQLRWIMWGTALGGLPFILAYGVPFALGFEPLPRTELTAIPLGLVPLAFASAIVRYRLMDVEVIIKRTLVYAAAVAAIVAIYGLFVQLARLVFLGGSDRHNSVIAILATLVVVLLARPVKDAIQMLLDRAYYRDRYDYRRALMAFAHDLNSDLDLHRLSERLVTRVIETLVIDRMALMLLPAEGDQTDRLTPIAARGFDVAVAPGLSRASALGLRLLAGHRIVIDDPVATRRLSEEELGFWRQHGVFYFLPCVSKEGTIAVMALGRRTNGEPLSSEDLALLSAVTGQVATALENARLYRRLGLKAAELERMRGFSENIVESLRDGLVVIDLGARVLRWNQRLEELYGVTRDQAIGARLDDLFDPAFVAALREARAGSTPECTRLRQSLLSRHLEGTRELLVNVAAVPLRTSEGTTTGTMVLVEDVTDRVRLEEQLQISEKMASIGLLAAGVAHEVNTPLTGISSFTQMLLQSMDPEDPKARMLEKIERQTFRAAKIVNGLLNLARPAQVEAGTVDVNAVLNDVLALLEHQLKSGNIQLRKELASPAPLVCGIEFKLQQVFLNLLLNARDAMPKGGWLSITTSATGNQAIIEVADTGSGIPVEHLSRIYDPFFTTKTIGQGTGLGLSITYGIIREHGGQIACDSTPGQGTKFTLALPFAALRERVGELSH